MFKIFKFTSLRILLFMKLINEKYKKLSKTKVMYDLRLLAAKIFPLYKCRIAFGLCSSCGGREVIV